ncbi:MAG: DNA starvation/stationary phase protection protein [Bryobacteraceae bacterium]|nr:DNA starvation/stationary phase protection protein [Bryobacteraceae bacterium]
MIATSRRPNLGLDDQGLDSIVQMLNRLLADEFVIYAKARNYHWNVTGPMFHSLHEVFEKQYEEVDEIIDEAAERARMYGGRAIGSLAEFQRETRLREQPGELPEAERMIENLCSDHESLIRALKGDIARCEELDDAMAADYLTGVAEQHQKMAWMLRAFLKG